MADQVSAILVSVGRAKFCFSCACLIDLTIHRDNRNGSYKTFEALGEDFRKLYQWKVV